jgi:hypothetical protein
MKIRWTKDRKGRPTAKVPAKHNQHGPCRATISKTDEGGAFWSASCAINSDGSGFSYTESGTATTTAQARHRAAVGIQNLIEKVSDHYRK